MLFKKFLIFIETWGLAFLVFLTIGTFAMAAREGLQGDPQLSVWGALMQTALSDAEKAQGWTGRMHLLVKITLAWAAVRVYMATAGLKWDHFSARWLVRSHVVIVAGSADPSDPATADGVDKKALALDLALAMAPDHKVVLAMTDVDEGQRSRLWQAGVRVVTDSLPTAQLLEGTGVRRARALIAMRDLHSQNIALTHAAVSPSLGNPLLEIKCMVEPLSVRRDFKVEEYFDKAVLPRIRIFNESELVARRLIQAFPPDAPVAQSEREGVHVVVVGLGSVGQSILVHLARVGHYRSGKKPKVTVVDRQVGERWREARQAHPALEQWLQVETEETRFEDVGPGQIRRWLTDERPVTVAYVCTKDEVANLRIARLMLQGIQRQQRADQPALANVVALDPPGGCVLADFAAHGEHEGRFHLFSLVHGSGGFLSEVDDARARQFHAGYCARDDEEVRRNPGQTPTESNRPWEALDETLRNANRMTADHFEVKMRAVGCRIVTREEAAGATATLLLEEIELLARMDHDRWWADRALDGWQWGAVTARSDKIHANMVPYDELTEPIKQLDRDSVQQMVDTLAYEGLVIVRDTPA
jgi:hypothetical protein